MRLFIDFFVSKEFNSEGRQTGCGGRKPNVCRRWPDLQRAVRELCRHMHKMCAENLVQAERV